MVARLALAPRTRHMPPLHFSDEEKDMLLSLSAPIAYGRRHEFIQAVAPRSRKPGPGSGLGSCTGLRARSNAGLCSRRNAKRQPRPRESRAWPRPKRGIAKHSGSPRPRVPSRTFASPTWFLVTVRNMLPS
jgi:hypothetical protein